MAIRERGNEHPERGAVVEREGVGDGSPELALGEVGRVDDQIGAAAQRFDRLTLEPDAVDHRPVAGERMAAAGRGVAPAQHLVVAVDEQQPRVDVGAGEQRRDVGGERVDVEIARANVDIDGDRAAVAGGRLDDRGKQRQR